MAGSSSRGSRPLTTWAEDRTPRSRSRVVRAGRAANDNAREPMAGRWLLIAAFATALAVLAGYMSGG